MDRGAPRPVSELLLRTSFGRGSLRTRAAARSPLVRGLCALLCGLGSELVRSGLPEREARTLRAAGAAALPAHSARSALSDAARLAPNKTAHARSRAGSLLALRGSPADPPVHRIAL